MICLQIGNPWVDDELNTKGQYDFFWSHALVPDNIYEGIRLNCQNFTYPSDVCEAYLSRADDLVWYYVYIYNIYAPFCGSPNVTWVRLINLPICCLAD